MRYTIISTLSSSVLSIMILSNRRSLCMRFLPFESWFRPPVLSHTTLGSLSDSKHTRSTWPGCAVWVLWGSTERDATNLDSNLHYRTISHAQSRASSRNTHRDFLLRALPELGPRELWYHTGIAFLASQTVLLSRPHTIPRISPSLRATSG